MKSAFLTDTGLIRTNNEDCVIYDSKRNIFGIADGMGGHSSGEVASKLAEAVVLDYTSNNEITTSTDLAMAVIKANHAIIEEANKDSQKFGMGTTLTLSVVRNGLLHYAHIGDSRLYLIRDGEIKQITDDHSKVWDLYKQGLLSKTEMAVHPLKNVLTKALGLKEDVDIDKDVVQLSLNDIFLICSDGLTDMLKDVEIKNIIENFKDNLKDGVEKLVEVANSKGGVDNVSVVLFKIEKEDLDVNNMSNKIIEKGISSSAPFLNKILFYAIGGLFWLSLFIMPIYLFLNGCVHVVDFVGNNKLFFSSLFIIILLLFTNGKIVALKGRERLYLNIAQACEFLGFCLLILLFLIFAVSFLAGCFLPLISHPVAFVKYILLISLLYFLHFEGSVRKNLFYVG